MYAYTCLSITYILFSVKEKVFFKRKMDIIDVFAFEYILVYGKNILSYNCIYILIYQGL